MPKEILKAVVRYSCSVCRKEYRRRKEAEKCETLPLERPKFAVGDMVYPIDEGYTCDCSKFRIVFRKNPKRHPRLSGKITKIRGPFVGFMTTEDGRVKIDKISDEIMKGFPLHSYGHVFQYDVDLICPFCKKVRDAGFWTSEIRKER